MILWWQWQGSDSQQFHVRQRIRRSVEANTTEARGRQRWDVGEVAQIDTRDLIVNSGLKITRSKRRTGIGFCIAIPSAVRLDNDFVRLNRTWIRGLRSEGCREVRPHVVVLEIWTAEPGQLCVGATLDRWRTARPRAASTGLSDDCATDAHRITQSEAFPARAVGKGGDCARASHRTSRGLFLCLCLRLPKMSGTSLALVKWRSSGGR